MVIVRDYDEEARELFESEEREQVKRGIDFAWGALSGCVIGAVVASAYWILFT